MNSELREFLESMAALTGVFFVIGSVGANETGSIGDTQLLVQCGIGFAVMMSGIPIEIICREAERRKRLRAYRGRKVSPKRRCESASKRRVAR